jgi:hypothetical protein
MFRTLNFSSSSGTHYFKLHTFTSIGTIVHTVKTEYHEFLTIMLIHWLKQIKGEKYKNRTFVGL